MPFPAVIRHTLALFALARAVAAAPSGPLLLDAARAGEAIVAVGEDGLVLRRAEPDADWTRSNAGTHATLTGVSFANDVLGWAVGHDGVVFRSIDGGETWTGVQPPKNNEISYLDVLALSEEHVIAIGAAGAYWETRDGGESWKRRRILDRPVHLNRLSRDKDGTLYIAGEKGVLLRSTNEGRRWTPLETDNELAFHGVLPLESGALLAYGLNGRVYRSTDRGDSWQRVDTGGSALILTGIELADGTVVLAGQPLLCLVSRDGGQTFRRAAHDVPAIARLIARSERELLSFGDGGVHLLNVP